MKRLVLFISIITLMCSCGKESGVEEPVFIDQHQSKIREYIKDTSEFEQGTISYKEIDGQFFIIGVRNKKVWVGEYDSQSKKEIQTWVGELPIKEKINELQFLSCVKNESDFALRVFINPSYDKNIANIGVMILNNKKSNIVYYGYSEQLIANRLFIYNIYSFSTGFFVAIDLNMPTMSSGSNIGSVFLSSDGKIICNSIQRIQSWAYYSGNATFMSGFTSDDKIWIGLCDKTFSRQSTSSAIELKEEWIGNDVVERNVDRYLGYGKSDKVYISATDIDQIMPTSLGYFVKLESRYIRPISTFDGYYCLCKGKISRVSEVGKGMYKWYKGSVLVVSLTNTGTVYSQDGTKIMAVNNIYDVDKSAIPTSYDSYVLNSQGSYDHKGELSVIGRGLGNNTAANFYTPIKKVASDAYITWNLLESETDIWKFQIDVLNYDGSKETIKYTLDVKTGKVVLI